MFKNLPPNKTREAYVTSGPSETKIEILTTLGIFEITCIRFSIGIHVTDQIPLPFINSD